MGLKSKMKTYFNSKTINKHGKGQSFTKKGY